MARCGCQGAGSTTCEAIVRCVALNLGPGLMFTNGRLQVRLSRDGGNCIRFGSDDGLYAECGDTPPGEGGKTIAGLPTPVQAGTYGGAGLVQSYASPQAIDYAVANRLDFIDSFSFSLQDDVAAWGPFTATQPVDTFTNNPASTPARELTSDIWVNLVADCGSPGGNPTGRGSGAPAAQLEPDGGWYGFLQQPYRLMTTAEALKTIAARTCVILQQTTEGMADVQANINAILSIQAQDWVMPSIGTQSLGTATEFLDRGIQWVCVNVNNNTTITPAAVFDSGATWVKINEAQGMARVQEFIDAGLQVLSGYTARQTTGQTLLGMGARGLISADPVYHRGAFGPDWQQYRTDVLSFQTRMTETGMLTQPTDTLALVAARGYPKLAEAGRFFNLRFGWTGGLPRNSNNQLLGKFCPIPNPTAYTISMECQVDQGTLPAGTVPKLGWIIGSDNDLDPSQVIGTPAKATRHGYGCFIRVGTGSTGQLVIGRYEPTGAFTELAVAATGPVTPNEWIELEVVVDDTSITLRRTNGTIGEVTVNDTIWRGPYVFHLWEDQNATTGAPFVHGYRNNRFIDAGTGAVVWDQLAQLYADWEEMATSKPTWAELAEGLGQFNEIQEF